MPSAMSDKRQQTRYLLENLRAPIPLGRKVALVIANNLAKIRHMRGCCGNYGQPGC